MLQDLQVGSRHLDPTTDAGNFNGQVKHSRALLKRPAAVGHLHKHQRVQRDAATGEQAFDVTMRPMLPSCCPGALTRWLIEQPR